MELSNTIMGAQVWLHVSGRVDALVSSAVGDEIDLLLEQHPEYLVVDLRDVDYLDSSGLAVLVRAWRRQTNHGRKFSIVMPKVAAASRVFTLAGFDQVFETIDAPNRDQATHTA